MFDDIIQWTTHQQRHVCTYYISNTPTNTNTNGRLWFKRRSIISKHILQQSVKRLSHKGSDSNRLRASAHNHLISRAVNIIDAANNKIKTYQEKNAEYEAKNKELQNKLQLLKQRQKYIRIN